MPGTVGQTPKRQAWSLARKTTVQEFINQCSGFEHTAVIYRQLMESLTNGCDMIILSMICNRNQTETNKHSFLGGCNIL